MKKRLTNNKEPATTDYGLPFFSKEGKSTFFNNKHLIPTQTSSTPAIQTKLSVNQPNDKFEKEADTVADSIVRQHATPVSQQQTIGSIQRKCTECEEEEKQVQKKSENNTSGPSPSAAANIESASGNGNALPAKTLTEMNSSFGNDFSDVHIHNDSESAKMNKELNAQAFTYGSDIYFNAGKFNPETNTGKHLLAHELTHVVQQTNQDKHISRKIEVPFEKSKPFASGNPNADSQGKVVEKYLNKLCVEGGFIVSGKNVIPPIDLCDLPGPIDGNIALTKAEQSKTKVGCTCLCDIIKSNNIVKIIIQDDTSGGTLANDENSEKPGVGAGSSVFVPSPDAPKVELPTSSGSLLAIDPSIILGHELCGHAFFNMQGQGRKDSTAQRGRGGHQATIERENLIRDEQGVERRATFREPFCGEFQNSSFFNECKIWRGEFNKLNGTNFKIEDSIPENPLEIKPADFRIDVFFNKDMPPPGFNPSTSFNQSVTAKGREFFDFAARTITDNPDKKFQLEAHASSDKPAGIEDYNRLLSERRMQLILNQLIKKDIDLTKLADKEDSGCDNVDTGLKNCSDTEAGVPGTAADRKVVIRIF